MTLRFFRRNRLGWCFSSLKTFFVSLVLLRLLTFLLIYLNLIHKLYDIDTITNNILNISSLRLCLVLLCWFVNKLRELLVNWIICLLVLNNKSVVKFLIPLFLNSCSLVWWIGNANLASIRLLWVVSASSGDFASTYTSSVTLSSCWR